MPIFDPSPIRARVEKAVLNAGEIIRVNSAKPKNIRNKGRIDLVTETDLAVEENLKKSLSAILPEADFLAEETSSDVRLGELTWIIDPVDGTTNFAHGLPLVATSVALWSRDRIVLGIINLPLLGELFSAVSGQGAVLNGEAIRVSAADNLEHSLVATGFPYEIEKHIDPLMENMRRVLLRARGVRRPGAAALDMAYVACGRYEAFYEPDLKPWDTAAGLLLVKEAGGMVTEFDPNQPYIPGGSTMLATNGRVHLELSELLTSL